MASASVSKQANQGLPGLEATERQIPEIQQSGAALLDVRTRRIALGKEEQEKEKLVVLAMEKHKKDFYSFDGLEVTISTGKTTAKVKHAGIEEEE